MKHVIQKLPENYIEIDSVDLEKDKKLLITVNVLAIILFFVCLTVMIPFHRFFLDMELDGVTELYGLFLKPAVLVIGYIAYIILHELTHGVVMKMFGTKKVFFGFKGLYAYAGSNEYYDKFSYLCVALAPIVVWGIILAVICALVPEDWFWIIYLIQAGNISGGAGDLYVTVRFRKLPGNVWIRDWGASMKVYGKE